MAMGFLANPWLAVLCALVASAIAFPILWRAMDGSLTEEVDKDEGAGIWRVVSRPNQSFSRIPPADEVRMNRPEYTAGRCGGTSNIRSNASCGRMVLPQLGRASFSPVAGSVGSLNQCTCTHSLVRIPENIGEFFLVPIALFLLVKTAIVQNINTMVLRYGSAVCSWITGGHDVLRLRTCTQLGDIFRLRAARIDGAAVMRLPAWCVRALTRGGWRNRTRKLQMNSAR